MVLNRNIAAFDIAGLSESLPEGAQTIPVSVSQLAVDKSDHWSRVLLRARRERPSHRRAAEQRDQLATLHLALTRSPRRCAGLYSSRQRPIGSNLCAQPN